MQSPLPTKHHRRSTKGQLFRRLLMLTIGAIIFALGLKGFLVPNNIIDGGIVGISIIGSKVTDTTLALWLFFLNTPFIFSAISRLERRLPCRRYMRSSSWQSQRNSSNTSVH